MSETPNGGVIHVSFTDYKGNVARIDITEGVQAAYDIVMNSMDLGSGFLDDEDVRPLIAMAEECGFSEIERLKNYYADKIHEKERVAWRSARRAQFDAEHVIYSSNYWDGRREHRCEFSSVGRCLFVPCPLTRT